MSNEYFSRVSIGCSEAGIGAYCFCKINELAIIFTMFKVLKNKPMDLQLMIPLPFKPKSNNGNSHIRLQSLC
jgi:hypothetical protein